MYICTYLKPPIPLVQIYLIIEHHLYQIYLDSSLSEYLSEVSPAKLSKDKKRNYFTFAIQNDNSMYQGVCFSVEKHALFNDVSKDVNSTGIKLKRFRSSENNEDITNNDFSSVKKTEVNFERKDFQGKQFTVQQVINKCAIYDIVDISGLVYNLQQETTNQKEGAPLRIRKGIMKDETGSIDMVLFSSVIDKISNNNCYDLKKMRIQKLMNNRILKSTESNNSYWK